MGILFPSSDILERMSSLAFQEYSAAGHVISAPGRVNLIGEHIDYHGLPVLPMAMRQAVRIAFQARGDCGIRVSSLDGFGSREFEWTAGLGCAPSGDWENYVRAAAQAVGGKWGVGRGMDAVVTSDVPPAAGLSSSSALLVAVALCLLRVNHREATFEELMEILPDGEQFVGTRGGGMDHAAILASRPGCASLIAFDPPSVRPIPIPREWAFLVMHSLESAEKSGGLREQYNARRRAGTTALQHLGLASYRRAIDDYAAEQLAAMAERLEAGAERDSFLHVTGESQRVTAAVGAMERADSVRFGEMLNQSHASLRDKLKVSSPALDQVVEAAMRSGALGARLTGAGFGGCAVAFCLKGDLEGLRAGVRESYYAGRADFHEERHLISVEAGAGALA